MLKIQKYIVLIAGMLLAFYVLAAVNTDTARNEISTAQTAAAPGADNSSSCVSGHEELEEDEQSQEVVFSHFFGESAVLFMIHQKSPVVFQPCFVPWQPPKA